MLKFAWNRAVLFQFLKNCEFDSFAVFNYLSGIRPEIKTEKKSVVVKPAIPQFMKTKGHFQFTVSGFEVLAQL